MNNHLLKFLSLVVMVCMAVALKQGFTQNTERYKGPVIDMHLHAYNGDDYWGGRPHPTGIASPETAEEHLRLTQEYMAKLNIVKAVIDASSVNTIQSQLSGDERFIPGFNDIQEGLPDIDQFEKLVKDGTIKVFGEVGAVYKGKTLNDPLYAPYLSICEKYGIPVAYHTGGGPSNVTYTCCPNFRLTLGNPLLIEDVLVKHPDLKIYLMHGGGVFHDYTMRMMQIYPQIYIDLGVLLWINPIVQDYAVHILQTAKKTGTLKRVMFGTDQMVWPGAMEKAVDFLNDREFLSLEDKADLFYNNAARFLQLSRKEIESHHKR